MEILHKLRSPEGCPWDKAQTAESFGACFAGEAAELLDAIDRKDSKGICEECGEDISLARLKARPVTTLCVSCKARQEEGEEVQGS